MSRDLHTVEGIARVVRVEDGIAWFEPEQTTSCGHCASSAACGANTAAVGGGTGIGSIARRIELRRFPLDNARGLTVGERVVVGVDERALLKASATAYAIPLLTAFTAGGFAHSLAGDDGITLLAMVGGLLAGFFAAGIAARALERHGELSPRYLRRATPGETCQTS